MILMRAPTLTRAWRGACDKMFFAHIDDTQLGIARGSSMTMCYRNVMVADSMDFDLDVWFDLHLTKSRFPVLQKTYLTLEEFDAFLVRCRNAAKERGAVTKLHANPHKPRGINRTKKTGNYAHGGCIHGWDFRMDKATKRPELAMHSRVSYLPYMGGLDLALSYCIAREVGQELNFAVEDFAFVWYCSAWQFAHMQSVAYVQNSPRMLAAIDKPKKWPDEEYPTIKLMRATLRSFREKMESGFTPEQEKFAQLMRYRKRWESRVTDDGRWGSIPLRDLNLNSLKAMRVEQPKGDGLEIELVEKELH
jgi:hypothetical protein